MPGMSRGTRFVTQTPFPPAPLHQEAPNSPAPISQVPPSLPGPLVQTPLVQTPRLPTPRLRPSLTLRVRLPVYPCLPACLRHQPCSRSALPHPSRLGPGRWGPPHVYRDVPSESLDQSIGVLRLHRPDMTGGVVSAPSRRHFLQGRHDLRVVLERQVQDVVHPPCPHQLRHPSRLRGCY